MLRLGTRVQVARLPPEIHDTEKPWRGEVIGALAASSNPAVVRELIEIPRPD